MNTITDPGALDALPDLSVVIDCDGEAWQKREGEWLYSGGTKSNDSDYLAAKYGPLTLMSRVSHVPDLEGATERPAEGYVIADAGQFAAVWNAVTPGERQLHFAGWVESAEVAARCVIANHQGLVDRERVSWLSSPDLRKWADEMLDFANNWHSNEPVGVTRDDLVRAAGIAQRLAHDHVTYAVKVQVRHFERAGEQAEIVVIDGRVLLDDVAVDGLMTEAGWIET